jgi:hypothetical protein
MTHKSNLQRFEVTVVNTSMFGVPGSNAEGTCRGEALKMETVCFPKRCYLPTSLHGISVHKTNRPRP